MKINPKILVIEDDKIFCKTIVSLLRKEGCDVESAFDGKRAVALAKSEVFDLIVSDVRLPGEKDGIETVEEIKSFNPGIKVFVMIMTGYADPDAPKRAEAAGVDDYIYKPFSMDTFLTSVKQYLLIIGLDREQKNIDDPGVP